MKPHRIHMTHNLLLNYGLYKKMEVYVGLYVLPEEIDVGLTLILSVATLFDQRRGNDDVPR